MRYSKVPVSKIVGFEKFDIKKFGFRKFIIRERFPVLVEILVSSNSDQHECMHKICKAFHAQNNCEGNKNEAQRIQCH